jgi:hypothetical protein
MTSRISYKRRLPIHYYRSPINYSTPRHLHPILIQKKTLLSFQNEVSSKYLVWELATLNNCLHCLKVTTVLIALLPTLAFSCAHYDICHCTNSDGSPNQAVTKQVCDGYEANIKGVDCVSVAPGQAVIGSGGDAATTFNNCDFRKDCNSAGAPGDSNCRAKDA